MGMTDERSDTLTKRTRERYRESVTFVLLPDPPKSLEFVKFEHMEDFISFDDAPGPYTPRSLAIITEPWSCRPTPVSTRSS